MNAVLPKYVNLFFLLQCTLLFSWLVVLIVNEWIILDSGSFALPENSGPGKTFAVVFSAGKCFSHMHTIAVTVSVKTNKTDG